jgi:hypothetical protein
MDAGRSQRLKSGMSASSRGGFGVGLFCFSSCHVILYEFYSALAPAPSFTAFRGRIILVEFVTTLAVFDRVRTLPSILEGAEHGQSEPGMTIAFFGGESRSRRPGHSVARSLGRIRTAPIKTRKSDLI